MSKILTLVVLLTTLIFVSSASADVVYNVSALKTPTAPTAIAFDAFNGGGTTLSAADWTKNVAGSSTGSARAVVTAAGRVRQSDAKWKTMYYSTAVPASADYTASADIYVASNLPHTANGVMVRQSTAADTGYYWRYSTSDSLGGVWQLYSAHAATYALLCAWYDTAAEGSTHRAALSATGAHLEASVDGTERCDVSDSSITAAGRPGFRTTIAENGLADSNSVQLDNFRAYANDAPTAPISYHGIRINRDWSFDDASGSWAKSDTPKTFGSPTSWANAPLADDAPLDTGDFDANGVIAPVNPTAANKLASLAVSNGTYLNRAQYTSPITLVSNDTPQTPVDCSPTVTWTTVKCSSVMNQIGKGLASDNVTDLHGGFPIPADYLPNTLANDTDSEAAFYQPDNVSPGNPAWQGRLYEAWKFIPNPNFDAAQPVSTTNPKWASRSTGRVLDLGHNNDVYKIWTSAGYQTANPGAPNSTWQYKTGMGVIASGFLIPSEQISREDCLLGSIDHAIGLVVPYSHPSFRAPATRTDGYTKTMPFEYGMHLRLPADTVEPTGLSRLGHMIFEAAKRHGLMIDDGTGGASIGMRVEPSAAHGAASECTTLLDGQAGYEALTKFPWAKLQVLASGS